jgi:DoxX-like family
MGPESQTTPVSKKMVWTGRIISALPVLVLIMSATMKLMKPTEVTKQFVAYGFKESILAPLGIVELACTALYVIPQTSVLGAILLTGYLGGATVTHLRAGEPFVFPIVFGVLVWLGLFLRDARVRALIPWRK